MNAVRRVVGADAKLAANTTTEKLALSPSKNPYASMFEDSQLKKNGNPTLEKPAAAPVKSTYAKLMDGMHRAKPPTSKTSLSAAAEQNNPATAKKTSDLGATTQPKPVMTPSWSPEDQAADQMLWTSPLQAKQKLQVRLKRAAQKECKDFPLE